MIRKWLADRKARRESLDYDKGYGYAMVEYFVHGEGIFDLMVHVDAAKLYGDYNSFDRGVRDACDKLEAIYKGNVRQYTEGYQL